MCNRGYRPVGVQIRICEDVGTSVGEFNEDPPVCERKYVTGAGVFSLVCKAGGAGLVGQAKTGPLFSI